MTTELFKLGRERGVDETVAGERVQFRIAIGSQFFTEIAKFRALRPLWTRVLVAMGASADAAARATVQAVTGRSNKTRLDAHVNMLRVTTEALSAVLGGCDGLHIAPFDELTGTTDEFSRRIATDAASSGCAGGMRLARAGLARRSWTPL